MKSPRSLATRPDPQLVLLLAVALAMPGGHVLAQEVSPSIAPTTATEMAVTDPGTSSPTTAAPRTPGAWQAAHPFVLWSADLEHFRQASLPRTPGAGFGFISASAAMPDGSRAVVVGTVYDLDDRTRPAIRVTELGSS